MPIRTRYIYSLLAIIGLSAIIMINNFGNDRMIVYKLGMNNTPALQNEPMIGDNYKRWNTEFSYQYKGPKPDDFKVEQYKKKHSDDIVIIHSMKDEEFITIYSNHMPDEDFFLANYRIGPTI